MWQHTLIMAVHFMDGVHLPLLVFWSAHFVWTHGGIKWVQQRHFGKHTLSFLQNSVVVQIVKNFVYWSIGNEGCKMSLEHPNSLSNWGSFNSTKGAPMLLTSKLSLVLCLIKDGQIAAYSLAMVLKIGKPSAVWETQLQKGPSHFDRQWTLGPLRMQVMSSFLLICILV